MVGHIRQVLQDPGKCRTVGPTTHYILIGKQKSSSRTVQSHVVGEPLPTQPTFPITPTESDVHSEHVAPPLEPPMGDQPERVEEIQQADFTPVPTVEQRRFSAPQSDWDPAR
jgi:hypothetical protein